MSYTQSSCTCDWCRGELGNGVDVACRRCYEERESEVADLKQEVEDLKWKMQNARDQACASKTSVEVIAELD